MAEVSSLPTGEDPLLVLQACAVVLGGRVLEGSRAASTAALRFGDGYVFQHLLVEPLSVTELADRLGVTQQAASQQVVSLEERGLVHRVADPSDGRRRLVELTALGHDAVEGARRSRAQVADELRQVLGDRRYRRLLRDLGDVSDHLGALAAMADRRLRPEAAR